MVRRLRALKEQNDLNPDDPLIKLTRGESLIDANPELQEIYEKLPQKTFEQKYQPQLQFSKVQNHVNQQSKDIALSEPWKGQESVEDASLRMILDSVGKPPSSCNSATANIAFKNPLRPIDEPRAVRASKGLRRKLEDAQDSILKYQKDKHQEVDDSEQSDFRTLYAEKFTPIGSFEKLRSLADKRIEESMKQGGFDDLQHIRGKPAPRVQLNPHIDRTEHHLNNMLVRQNISPPWIESQGRVNSDVSTFRKEAVHMFENEVTSHLKKIGALHTSWPRVKSIINAKFGSVESFLKSRYLHWKSSHVQYLESKIKSLNNNLRTYNLQAPLSTQKLYLIPEKELDRVYRSIDLEQLVTKILEERVLETGKNSSAEGGYASRFKFPTSFKFW